MDALKPDKLKHVVAGAAAVLFTLAALWLGQRVSVGAALAFASTSLGIGYELLQRYRREGQPEVLDAVATAAPGWVAWLALEALT